MPDIGYYGKRPRPQQREFLVRSLLQRGSVDDVTEVDDHHYVVEREGKSTLHVYLTNKYMLSVADVMEILEESHDTNCIVSTMGHNRYSPEAKEYCRDLGVGLFRTPELLGAVYYDGDRFIDYMPPERR